MPLKQKCLKIRWHYFNKAVEEKSIRTTKMPHNQTIRGGGKNKSKIERKKTTLGDYRIHTITKRT